jgi:hypothetical protein
VCQLDQTRSDPGVGFVASEPEDSHPATGEDRSEVVGRKAEGGGRRAEGGGREATAGGPDWGDLRSRGSAGSGDPRRARKAECGGPDWGDLRSRGSAGSGDPRRARREPRRTERAAPNGKEGENGDAWGERNEFRSTRGTKKAQESCSWAF